MMPANRAGLLTRMVAGALLFCLVILPGSQLSGRAALPDAAADDSQIWGTRPVLGFLVDTPALAASLQSELSLSDVQYKLLEAIAAWEQDQIRQVEDESLAVISDPSLSLGEKKAWVAASGYNAKIMQILEAERMLLEKDLGRTKTSELAGWVENVWKSENSAGKKVFASLAPGARKTYPRSFEVYATRYDAGDRKIVALPDKCLKFANGGALRCEGAYEFGQAYSVAISYEGMMVVALVGESGPWNVDDNYWSKYNDPQPRRMFADLPLGVPEAQAAYFDGYNGGLDQFGRLVTSPVAIDISRALAGDLELPAGNNKVTVSFLWTEGWDSPAAPSTGGTVAPAVIPGITWEKATPNPDGSIIHVVISGQTLVGIASVYEIPLPDLLRLNGLTTDSLIYPGDRIMVRAADPTPTAVPSRTPTLPPTHTPRPVLTASPTASPTRTTIPADSTPDQAELKSSTVDSVAISIALIGLLGIGLLTWGVLLQRKRQSP